MSATVGEARSRAVRSLRAAPLATPFDALQLEVDLLLASVLGCTRAHLLAWPNRDLADNDLQAFNALISRRAQAEPLAYLLGRKSFYGIDLGVSRAVLVPRDDTETLIDTVIARMDHAPRTVLELGTGSGAIALALASQRPDWRIVATDISAAALVVALDNCLRHDEIGVQIRLVRGHWSRCFADHCADAIISNPPYIPLDDPVAHDLRFEPPGALFSGVDGLDDLRAIIQDAPRVLRSNGWLLLEHGASQGEAVRALVRAAGFIDVATCHDLANHERVTCGRMQ